MSPVSAADLIAGRYRLDRRLAAGPIDEVWLGTDLELARPVAVKLLAAEAAGTDAVVQFRAAASRAGSVVHEGIVRVFDYCDEDPSESTQCPFLVMEYVDGQSLAGQLDAAPLSAVQAVDIVAQVASALQPVHQAGLAHGDIRPQKILLGRDGSAKLFGFSSARPAGPAAIRGDLRALGDVARNCLAEPRSPGHAGGHLGQIPAPVTELVAALCGDEPADHPNATAAIARRAAALRGQLGQSGRSGDREAVRASAPARPPRLGSALPLAPTLARLPGRPARPVAASAGPSAMGAGQEPARRGKALAIRACSVLAIALAAVAVLGALKPNGGAPQADGTTASASVRVNEARLTGRPVNGVRLRLQRLGLVVRLRWRASDTVSAGDVVVIRPVGLLPVHSVVVIVGSTGPAATNTGPGVPPAGDTHSHRHPIRITAHGPPSQSPASSPSPSPSSSPAPSASPTSSPSPPPDSTSPSASSSPSGSPPASNRDHGS